jgi:CDP-glycerol glycerophosphotransferase
MVPHPKHTAGIDWPGVLREFSANPRFALARSSDAGPFLAAADVLVTDHSSVGFEFALLDRPLIVFDAPDLREAARIDREQWELLRTMSDVVEAPDQLAHTLREALREPARRREARARARHLFAFPGAACDRAIAVVYELLEVEPRTARARDPRHSTRWEGAARV